MPNNKRSPKPIMRKSNLIIAIIAVVVVGVAIVSFIPKDNKGNSIVNGTTDIKDTTDATNIKDTKDTTDTTNATNSSDNTALISDVGVAATLNEEGDVVIQIADITEKATFFEYDSNGTTIGLFAVKASDGTVRTALNTCQVCNGSPKAYFKQEEADFQCQNCGNLFSLDMIEQERGGCNPVPIMAEEKTVTDTEIIIPATYLDENASIFENWKQF